MVPWKAVKEGVPVSRQESVLSVRQSFLQVRENAFYKEYVLDDHDKKGIKILGKLYH